MEEAVRPTLTNNASHSWVPADCIIVSDKINLTTLSRIK